MTMSHHDIGMYILRFGLAAVFLWFGLSQVTSPAEWVGWVPAWATSIIPVSAEVFVLANGTLEVVGGALLVAGFYLRPAALVLALHLAIITFDIGYNEIGVRDFGLMMATLSLVFLAKPVEERAAVAPATTQQ